MTGADLTHVDTWLFDLDNTLYPLESGIAAQMDEKITDYMVALTGLERGDARALQKQYLADYGTTLNGLLLHHQVDPPHYHAFVHDLALDAIAPTLDLRAAVDAAAWAPTRTVVIPSSAAGSRLRSESSKKAVVCGVTA